ncbi:WSSV128 [White spot syndrome virus]|uniref:WSSV128 n=1 Tax=White spot syndrome virus TaxID=342409 RepID=A0A2I6SBN4_9VIRU|nr:WSSV128 [White spot syndrome virus]
MDDTSCTSEMRPNFAACLIKWNGDSRPAAILVSASATAK